MPGILFIVFLALGTVVIEAKPETYASLDGFKAGVANAVVDAAPVDYTKLN